MATRRLFFLLLFCTLLPLAALAADTPAPYNYISAPALEGRLTAREPIHLVDIQVEEEFAKHHITGATATPDGRTMFINIQHPGESPSERSDPKDPRRFSNWPDRNPNGRPRSATVVIRRNDGGVIGT